MSGPKGYGYAVVSAEELRRREDQAREGRCQQHVMTLAGLAGELEFYGVQRSPLPKTPKATSHESLISWEEALQLAIAQTQQEVHKAAAAATMRALNAAKVAVDITGIHLGERSSGSQVRDPGTAERDERQRLSVEVSKVVDLLAGLRDRALRSALVDRALEVLSTANPAQARGDLLTVKSQAADALRRQLYADLASQSVLEIAHLESAAALGLRARASSAINVADVTEIRAAVASLLDANARARDAEFVHSALTEVLAELGFEVDEDFELPELGHHASVAGHQDHPGYGLRLQINPESSVIYTRLVAEAESDPEADAAAEEATCAKVKALASGLGRHGVAAELKFERQPGERPVERREEAAPARAARKKARRHTEARPQERSAR